MDEVSDSLQIECGGRVDGGADRISLMPDEIIIHILSFLRFKEAAATTVLSSRWLDLWKHIPHIKLDRISQLPNQIFVVILSFLTLRQATTTSVLSSRWSDLWKHTPNLNFDMHILRDYDSDDDVVDDVDDIICDAQRNKCIEIVNSVLQSHKALCLKNFRLALPSNYVAKYEVTKWLKFVFSRQVESLELLFDELDGLVLEELLRESRICMQPQTDLIFFQSLERLWLRFLKVSSEGIELFLRNCPLLEQLAICGGILTSDIELSGANLALKHLDIVYCSGGKSIKVSAPNLTCIKFISDKEVKLLLENVQNLLKQIFICKLEMLLYNVLLLQHLATFPNCKSSPYYSLHQSCYFSCKIFWQMGFKCQT